MHVVDFALEAKSTMNFTASGIRVELSATADRVELLRDGTFAIIDFKTGQPKSAKQVLLGLEPQLALEAAIGKQAGFGALKAGLGLRTDLFPDVDQRRGGR